MKLENEVGGGPSTSLGAEIVKPGGQAVSPARPGLASCSPLHSQPRVQGVAQIRSSKDILIDE